MFLVEIGAELFYSDGERAILVESNSPENRLKYSDFGQLATLDGYGVDSIYFTIYGGDDTSIRLNDSTFEKYKAQVDYWYALDERNVCHVIITEWENHDEYRDISTNTITQKDFIYRGMLLLAILEDRPFIINLGEELDCNMSSYINWSSSWFKAEVDRRHGFDPVIAVHNPLHCYPWEDFRKTGLIDLITFQGRVNQAYPYLLQEQIRGGFAIGYNEMVPAGAGIPSDSMGGDDLFVEMFFTMLDYDTGYYRGSLVGLYSGYNFDGCDDLSCIDVTIHESAYRRARQLADFAKENTDPFVKAKLLGIEVPSYLSNRYKLIDATRIQPRFMP